MDKEELLYKFFSNQLTEEQEKTFQQLLETDVEFKAQFEFENDLQRVIKKNQNENLKQKLVGFEKEINTEDRSNFLKWAFKNWSIAASIALLVGLGWIGYNTFSGQITTNYMQPILKLIPIPFTRLQEVMVTNPEKGGFCGL